MAVWPSPAGRLSRATRSSMALVASGGGSSSGRPRSTALYFLAFLALLGFAPDFMAKEVLGDLARGAGRAEHLRARPWSWRRLYVRRAERLGPDGRGGRGDGHGDFNGLAVAIFAVVLAITLLITRWAAKRTHSATEFYAAGRGIAGAANGIATAGDYLSASTFLGYAGLMYLYGFDGWIIGLGALLSFLPVLYLLAERMRNAGKFTVADVLAFRLRERPVRIATAINTLLISGIYLVAQLDRRRRA